MKNFSNYLKQTKGELKNIVWPTRRTAVIYTILVIIISLAIAAYLGALDYIFVDLFESLAL